MDKLKEILNQLKLVIKPKTVDALLPAVIFTISNSRFSLFYSALAAILSAVILIIIRAMNKTNIKYSLGGLVIVTLAAGLAYFSNNAANYYLPSIINNSLVFVVALISIIVKKPLAALTSHLSRGWDLNWYLRKDILPAYTEVTMIWTVFFLIRTAINLKLYLSGDAVGLGTINVFLSLPFTILILIISYLYGLWRLDKLGGPSIDEYNDKMDPPWQGQKFGF